MDFENEKKEFIKKHLLEIENVTEDILKEIDNGEGIIITMKDGRIIDISAVWSDDDIHKNCWDIRIYKSYEEYCHCEYYYDDNMTMEELTINHIKNYMRQDLSEGGKMEEKMKYRVGIEDMENEELIDYWDYESDEYELAQARFDSIKALKEGQLKYLMNLLTDEVIGLEAN